MSITFCRDRPQMVRLTRISSDFNIAKMRDSFMRQFMEQVGDSDLLSGPKSDPDDIKTSGKHLELPLLVDQRQKSLMGTPTRKAVVSSLIRLVTITLQISAYRKRIIIRHFIFSNAHKSSVFHRDSNKQRILNDEGVLEVTRGRTKSLMGKQHMVRMDTRR